MKRMAVFLFLSKKKWSVALAVRQPPRTNEP